MKLTLDIQPAAFRLVKAVSRKRKITLDEAASQLILFASIKGDAPLKTRNGIPLARNDGVRMTADEVAAALDER